MKVKLLPFTKQEILEAQRAKKEFKIAFLIIVTELIVALIS